VPVEEVVEEGEAVPGVLPGLRAHRNRVDRPPLAVVRLGEHRHQRLEVDDPLTEVALGPEHVQVGVHVGVAQVDVADRALRQQLDELDLVRERLGRLHVVVPDHAAGLEVARVVHELEVRVTDVIEHLHRLRRLVERLQRLELPKHHAADLRPLLGVVLERTDDPVPDLGVVGVVRQRPRRSGIDAHARDLHVGRQLQVALEVLEVLVVDLLRAGRPRQPEQIAVGAGRDPGDLEVEVVVQPCLQLATAHLVREALDRRVVEEAAELDPVVAERRQHRRHLLHGCGRVEAEGHAPGPSTHLCGRAHLPSSSR